MLLGLGGAAFSRRETELLPILVGPFLDGLQAELAYHSQLRSGGAPSGPRMRVNIAVGPLTDSDEG